MNPLSTNFKMIAQNMQVSYESMKKYWQNFQSFEKVREMTIFSKSWNWSTILGQWSMNIFNNTIYLLEIIKIFGGIRRFGPENNRRMQKIYKNRELSIKVLSKKGDEANSIIK